MKLTRAYKDIWDGIKICDPHERRLESTDERKKVIYEFEWMWSKQDMTLYYFLSNKLI